MSARDARTVAAELLALAEKATFGGVWGVMGIEANTNICVAQRSDVALVCRTLLEGAQDRERLDWLDAERAKWGNPPLSRNARLEFHIPSWEPFRAYIDREIAATRPTTEDTRR